MTSLAVLQDLDDTTEASDESELETAQPEDFKEQLETLRNELDNGLTDAMKPVKARWSIWSESMNFYRGRQWTVSRERWPTDPMADFDDRVRTETRNRIQDVVRIGAARWEREDINFYAKATNKSRQAKRQAETVTKAGKALFHNNIFTRQTRYITALAAHIYGGAFYEIGWNDQLHQGMGEAFINYRSILDVYPDMRAVDNSDMSYVYVRKRMSYRLAKQKMPLDFFGMPTDERFLLKDARPDEGFSEEDQDFSSERYCARRDNDLVEFHQYFELPTFGPEGYTRGRFFMFSGPMILDVGPLPGAFPLIFIKGPNQTPGGLYADGAVQKLISLQRSINYAASKAREASDICTAPSMLIEANSNVERGRISDIAGEQVIYKDVKPEWMNPPNIEPVLAYPDRLDAQFDGLSTYAEISAGKNLPSQASGRMIAIADGLSTTSTEPEVALWRDANLLAIKGLLQYQQENYQEGRIIRLLGPNGKLSEQLYKQDLFPNVIDLALEASSKLPTNPAVKRAEIAEYFGMGLFDPNKPGAKQAMALMNLNTEMPEGEDMKDAHQERAEDEALAFLRFINQQDGGRPPELDKLDNDEIHLADHQDFYIREVLSLPDELREQAKAIWSQHILEHEMAFRQKQLDLQQQTAGGQAQGGSNDSAPAPKDPQAESPMDGGRPSAEGAPTEGMAPSPMNG